MASEPLRIVHPASDQSLSVGALRVAVGETAHRDEGDWIALLQAGYRFPKLEPGEQVDLEDLEVLVEFVAQRAERTAAMAVELHDGLVTAGLSEARSRSDIVGGLAGFITRARRWLDTARRVGGTAAVEVGVPSIDDPSLPKWRCGDPRRDVRPDSLLTRAPCTFRNAVVHRAVVQPCHGRRPNVHPSSVLPHVVASRR